MASIEVEVKGLSEIIKALEGGAEGIRKAAQRGMAKSVAFGQAFLAEYPPAPPGSSYRRTGTLGRSWTTRVLDRGSEVHGLIGNNVPYSFEVQDADRQAPVHRGRWQTVQDLTREPQAGTIQRMIQAEIESIIDGINAS
jgi:hypothetical protein